MSIDMAHADGTLRHDYVIVGAGSAGCVLAARLSENPDTRVLLLESGPEDTRSEIAVPLAWPALWGTEVDYAYDTVPQAGTAGLRHDWPRGHTLGGSSSINAMVFLRGHPNDFDSWNCPGWDYESVLPYFKRMETVEGGDRRYRGTDGPMRPARAHPDAANPLSEVFIRGLPQPVSRSPTTSTAHVRRAPAGTICRSPAVHGRAPPGPTCTRCAATGPI